MGIRSVVIKNVSANAFAQIVTVISGFILPPLIVATYGSTVNGMVASARQFIAYLMLLEAGMGAAGLVALYPALAKNDHLLRNRILASIRHFYRISGSLFTVGLLILAFLYAWLTRHQLSPYLTFWVILVLGSVNVVDFFFFSTYRLLIVADQKNYIFPPVNALFTVVYIAIAYQFIKTGYSILDIQILSVAFSFTKFVLFYFYVRKNYGRISLQYDRNNPYKIEQNWDVMVHMVGGLVVFSTPIVLVTTFMTLKDASIYAVYALVFNGVSQGLQVLVRGLAPIFGYSLRADKTNVLRQFRRFELFYLCALGWVYTCTALLVMPFIAVYTRNMHDANYHQPLLATLFVISGILMNIRIPAQVMLEAAGHYKETKWRSVCEASINLIVSIISIQIFGLFGILFGSLAAAIYRSNDVIIYNARKIIHASFMQTYGLLLCLIIIMSICMLVWHPVITAWGVNSYKNWLIQASCTAIVVAIPFYVIFWIGVRWVKFVRD